MYVVLLSLGIAAGAAGMAMIGFGIAINEFSLGNTLLITGVTALVGGFVTIGLAAAVGQLGRIVELLSARPTMRAMRPGEPLDPLFSGTSRPGAPAGRAPMPSKPGQEGPGRPPPRPLEPRFAAPSIQAPQEVQVERPRPRPSSLSGPAEPALVDGEQDLPLSPATPLRSTPFPPLRPDVGGEGRNPTVEKETAARSESRAPTQAPATPRVDASSRPAADSAADRNLFASLWTSRPGSRPAMPEDDAAASASSEPAPAQSATDETRSAAAEPGLDRTSAASEPRTKSGYGEARPVSILKSGVVDGMAYTLYSDGSIEAELAEGTLRFGSIEELRDHLEKHP